MAARSKKRRYVTVVVDGWRSPRSPDRAEGWTYWVPGYVGELVVGDHVIVEAPRDKGGRLVEQSGIPQLADVIDVKPPKGARDKATKWIVGKVDWPPYRMLAALASQPEEA